MVKEDEKRGRRGGGFGLGTRESYESCPGWRSDEGLPVQPGIRSQARGKHFHKLMLI